MVRDISIRVVTAATALVLYLGGLFPQVLTVLVPSGAIVAFNAADCLNGWKKFEDAKDKFIIAAGDKKRFNDEGGSETIRLTADHLPKHFHKMRIQDSKVSDPNTSLGLQEGGKLQNQVMVFQTDPDKTMDTEPVGNDSVEIPYLPPYIALTYCKKD